jgi:hypothetical protein
LTLWARKAAADSANNASAAAAAGGGGGSGSTFAERGAAAAGGGVKAEANKQAAKASKPKHQQPARPPASPWLRPMPDPIGLNTPIQLLATLELPFKTVKVRPLDATAAAPASLPFWGGGVDVQAPTPCRADLCAARMSVSFDAARAVNRA